MQVFPQYGGPMSTWPEVRALPGAAAALEALKPNYRLAVATNAAESGETLVCKALERVGLERFFDVVITAKELGEKKPSLAYYNRVVSLVSTPASSVLMVGDDFFNDIFGAKNAGLQACWFNDAGNQKAPPIPFQDSEIHHMSDLPQAVEEIQLQPLPDIPACLKMMEDQGTTENLLQHVFAVSEAAYLLACMLADRGFEINPILAQRGGLLHDLDKLSAKRLKQPHSELSERILQQAGYPQLAQIARRHMILTILNDDLAPRTLEEKLVYYGDKVAVKSRMMGVNARIDSLLARYPTDSARIELCRSRVLALEDEICDLVGYSAKELVEKLSDGISRATPQWNQFLATTHIGSQLSGSLEG